MFVRSVWSNHARSPGPGGNVIALRRHASWVRRRGRWNLQATCRGGAQVAANPLPAGAEITVEFMVGVDDPAGESGSIDEFIVAQPSTVPPTLPANSAGPPPTQSPSNASPPGSIMDRHRRNFRGSRAVGFLA